MSIPCLLEHMRDVAGQETQTAALAEPKDSVDDMIEPAIRDDPTFGKSVSDKPAGKQEPEDKGERVEEGEVVDDDMGIILVGGTNGAPLKIPSFRKIKWMMTS